MVNFFDNDDIDLANLVGSLFLMIKNLQSSEQAVMLGTTLAGHDMRNTLGILLTAAQMLYEKIPVNERIPYLFSNIEVSVNLLTFLTRTPDVFSYWEPEYERVGFMGDVLAPIVGLMTSLAERDDLNISYDNEEFKQMPMLCLDCQRMQQLVYTILVNSVKYTTKECENRQISIRYRGKEDGYFCVDFVDYGIGVEEKDVPRIFKIGKRGEEARKVSFEGQGKGLPAALIIAKKHGGSVVVTHYKEPTIFRLKLPTFLEAITNFS